MKRIGMRREGHAVTESLHRSGQWLDTVTYARLATEWAAPQRPAEQARSHATTSTGRISTVRE